MSDPYQDHSNTGAVWVEKSSAATVGAAYPFGNGGNNVDNGIALPFVATLSWPWQGLPHELRAMS